MLDAVGEPLVVDHLPGAVSKVEAGHGSECLRVVSEAAGGSQQLSVLTGELGHPDSVAGHARLIVSDVELKLCGSSLTFDSQVNF